MGLRRSNSEMAILRPYTQRDTLEICEILNALKLDAMIVGDNCLRNQVGRLAKVKMKLSS